MRIFLVAGVLIAASGCGGGFGEVKEVVGAVTLDRASPKLELDVVFWPAQDLRLGAFAGRTQDGRFDIRPDAQRGEGRAGSYVVVVSESLPPMVLMSLAREGCPLVPERYKHHGKTPLLVEVHEGCNELAPFDLPTVKFSAPR